MALRAVGELKAHRTIAGRSAIKIGPAVNGYTAIGSVVSIGAVEGAVEINPNHEVTKLFDSALQGPYGTLVTQHDWMVSATINEIDMWNWALALSYSHGAVTESSALVLGASSNLGTRTTDDFYSMQIKTESPRNAFNDAVGIQTIEFFKVFPSTSGAYSADRSAAANLAIDFNCLSNDTDDVGRVFSSIPIAVRAYKTAVA